MDTPFGWHKRKLLHSRTGVCCTIYLHEKGKFSEWMICSNVKEIVEHQQYVFDSFWNIFWNISSSAERKTLEDGIKYHLFCLKAQDN